MQHSQGFINFTLNADLRPAERLVILHMIRQMPEVHHAGFVHERSRSAVIRCMAYAYLKPDTDCKATYEKIKAIPGVASASLVENKPSSSLNLPPPPQP